MLKKINFSKLILRIFFLLILIIISYQIIPIALAAEIQLQIPIGERQTLEISGSTIGEYVQAVVMFASAAIISLAIVMVIVGGLQWIISGGSPDKIGNAKNTIVKAFLGMFIAIFAVFVLQTINPALVRFAPLTLTHIEGLQCCQIEAEYFNIGPDECESKGGNIVDYTKCIENKMVKDELCADKATKPCGEEYQNETTKANCLGTKCPATETGAPQVCRDDGTGKLTCIGCKNNGEECADDIECCEERCARVGDKKVCTTVDGDGDGIWDFCSVSGCKPGLVCSDGYAPDRCVYGRTGNKCNDDSDCAQDYVCVTDGINHCEPKAVFSRCDDDHDCPTGTRCRNPRQCKANEIYWQNINAADINDLWEREKDKDIPDEFTGLQYSSDTSSGDIQCEDWCSDITACGAISWPLCLPDNVPCLCLCTNSSQCANSTMPNAPSANYCYDGLGDNYCQTGEEGNKCAGNDTCISGLPCNTKNANVCTSGKLGVTCDSNAQCTDGYTCCGSNFLDTGGHCFPETESCPH